MTFSLLVKPVSSDCNFNCTYCYYRGKNWFDSQLKPRMTEDVLRKVIQSYFQTDQEVFSMIWHGGEPTLMPDSFFEQVVEFQKQLAAKGSRISNSIQTNGSMISSRLAALCSKYKFLCGVSLDGPPAIHNRYRRTMHGASTHSKVLKGISTLNSAGVPVNILVLVHRANIKKPLVVYRYLKNLGFSHIQFIPCVERDEKTGKPTAYSIHGKEWGEFLVAVFNDWYRHDIHRLSIRLFETVLAKIVHGTAIDCYNGKACDRYLVVEYNGDIYPCDFYVHPEYKLGNIMEESFDNIIKSNSYKQFSRQKSNWHIHCDACEFNKLCMGDCQKYRSNGTTSSQDISWLCEGWKHFYGKTLDRFHALVQR